MSLLPFDALPAWAMLASLAAHLLAGVALGLLYFHGLWRIARNLAGGGRVTTTVALMVGRFAMLGGLLTLASLEGALPLLAMALGVLVARFVVMRRVAAP